MRSNLRHTAIIYFSRSARAEVKARGWKSELGFDKAFRALHGIIQHTKKIAESSAYPVFHIDEKQQQGKCFGEKFTNAIASIFQQGYDNVIVVGNDCSELTVNDFVHTHNALEQHQIVLGRTQKGGVYLFGIQKEAFVKEQLEAIEWQTNLVADSIYAISEQPVFELEQKSEFHSLRELTRLFRKQQISQTLKSFALQLLAFVTPSIQQSTVFIPVVVRSSVSRRGPPVL